VLNDLVNVAFEISKVDRYEPNRVDRVSGVGMGHLMADSFPQQLDGWDLPACRRITSLRKQLGPKLQSDAISIAAHAAGSFSGSTIPCCRAAFIRRLASGVSAPEAGRAP
jgi:hypothetical protein